MDCFIRLLTVTAACQKQSPFFSPLAVMDESLQFARQRLQNTGQGSFAPWGSRWHDSSKMNTVWWTLCFVHLCTDVNYTQGGNGKEKSFFKRLCKCVGWLQRGTRRALTLSTLWNPVWLHTQRQSVHCVVSASPDLEPWLHHSLILSCSSDFKQPPDTSKVKSHNESLVCMSKSSSSDRIGVTSWFFPDIRVREPCFLFEMFLFTFLHTHTRRMMDACECMRHSEILSYLSHILHFPRLLLANPTTCGW